MPEDPKSLCEGHWQSKFFHCVPVILWDGAFSICSWLILWMISVLLYGEVGNTCKFLICCQFKESSVTVSLKQHKAVQSGRSPVPAPSTISSGGSCSPPYTGRRALLGFQSSCRVFPLAIGKVPAELWAVRCQSGTWNKEAMCLASIAVGK